MARARPIAVLAVMAAALTLGACASGARSDFGFSQREASAPIGFPNVRFSIEDDAAARSIAEQLSQGVPKGPDGHFDLVALSGGGANGAFAAGLMAGWTESGARPDFEVVTGVSTGALAAPFVFLGSDWDDELRRAYTDGEASGLLKSRGLRAFFGSGVFSGAPLRALIDAHVDDRLLRAVAAEHARGRTLLVATTDLDAQRGVIWNMGAIAAQGGPEALDLFRQVLAASASIPGVFPPVMIRAQGRGAEFEEMHVDGGVMNPFVALPQIMWGWDDPSRVLEGARVHVIVNGKDAPRFHVTRDAAPTVLGRALDTVLGGQLRQSLAANRAFAERRGVTFRVAAIPEDFDGGDSLDFSQGSMQAVYDLGRALGRSGEAWK
ncbi:MAG: patatin-like phospholipase family protein [Brevundimonas sp.]|uniref:patatin-like phospholipase family protein n=1 Tax=Brevundimonas sp. TaxID=1871086 RepID=UPI0025B8843E|nr:patatin-like phospholipase family protein [Brevundimonas sp.]MBX3477125.1 patatin-like phospholipase family protein [Brevundimonas sp.]